MLNVRQRRNAVNGRRAQAIVARLRAARASRGRPVGRALVRRVMMRRR